MVSIKILGGLNRFYGYPTSPSASMGTETDRNGLQWVPKRTRTDFSSYRNGLIPKPTYLPPQSPTYLCAYLSIFLPTYLPTYIHIYLHTYLPTHTYIFLLGSFLLYPTLPFLVPTEVRFDMSRSLSRDPFRYPLKSVPFRSVSVPIEVRFGIFLGPSR